MTLILSDKSKFLPSKDGKDRTGVIEGQLTECLKRLKHQKVIPEEIYEKIRPSGTIVPRLYGLPKIHKPDVPLRPILDMCNSPYHATAKWLAEILEPLRRQLCVFSLRDSFEFVELMRDMNLNRKLMCSLDVSSLFTNVPLMETVNFICDQIRNSDIAFPLSTSALRELLPRCTFQYPI